MKLKFQKTESGDITAHILNDNDVMEFSYIFMIKALMDGQRFDCEYDGLTDEEIGQIESLKTDILKKVFPEENGQIGMFPNV